ncbi:MAG TPA: hypothetical protein DF712_01530 [Balneola sp.]|nr:hypothetical protein [Balneola sp.]|tara:strand:+ start:1388 stop:2068 length:681 start_codon:yes stop_codon:yes gene_type:complete
MINVILTVWKRNNLEDQLRAIYDQTADISDVYVYQNESHIDITYLRDKYNFKHVHSKDMNFKFHGRFTLPLLFTSKYTAIFDDDTIPNPKWLEHCIKVSDERNCIVGGNGRNYSGRGDRDCCGGNEDVAVDIVGHCWFFKTEWIHYMWRESAPTFDNGEDIHFCASCKIHGNIDSYYPSGLDPETWGDVKQMQYGIDEHASWRKSEHTPMRNKLYEHWMSKGWTTR